MKRCFHCFGSYGDEFNVCPFCGTVENPRPKEPIFLWPGTVLNGRYVIGESIGAGGFGIVYRALDMKLDNVIAIKEFFPQSVVTRAEGQPNLIVIGKKREEYEYRKKRFLLEARTMAKFGKHRSIPNVFEFFEANESAYIVMELLEGQQLNDYIEMMPDGKVDLGFAVYIANEIGQALITMHNAKVIHRDVAPDNIFICSGTELQIKLMDLGAAKIEDSSDDVIDLCMKVGYSPVEQYDKTDNFGPWSDIYALGATMYHMLTGVRPYESTTRKKEDFLQDVNQLNPQVPENLSNTIMKAMAINGNERFATVEEFLKAVNGEKKVLSLEKEKKKKRLKIALGITAAMLAVTIGAVFGFMKYQKTRKEKFLREAKISVWYLKDDTNPLETQALETITQNFNAQEGYEKVEIELVAYTDRTEYEKALQKAADEGKLPAVFESTDVSDEVLKKASDAEKVITLTEECSVLQNYSSYYSDKKRIPLAVEVPIAYVLTDGADDNKYVLQYNDDYFNNDTFKKNVKYVEEDQELLEKNHLEAGAGKYDSSKDDWSVVLASTTSFTEVKKSLSDKWFAVKLAYYDTDQIHSAFTYEWSIGNGTADEINAAEHFASWLLGANAQVNLLGSTGMVPVNDKALHQRAEGDEQWTAVEKIADHFVFDQK